MNGGNCEGEGDEHKWLFACCMMSGWESSISSIKTIGKGKLGKEKAKCFFRSLFQADLLQMTK